MQTVRYIATAYDWYKTATLYKPWITDEQVDWLLNVVWNGWEENRHAHTTQK